MTHPIDDLEIDEVRFEIRRNGIAIAVEPKVFDLIRLLAQNAGRVVSREDLLSALWPGLHVTDASLRRAVREARRALAPLDPIQTVPRRGLAWGSARVPAEGARSAIVGRTRELAELRRTLMGLSSGGGACVFLSGEAGIGKTTLLDTFLVELASHPRRVATASAGCDAGGELAEPHQVWLRLLGKFAGARRSSAEMLERLAPHWAAQLPGGTPRPPPPNPRARLLRELAAFLSAQSARRPLVLVLDDLHAADESSLALLFGLVRLRALPRVLLLGAYRRDEPLAAPGALSGEIEALRLRGLAQEIPLGALALEDVSSFAAARTGAAEPQLASLAALLHARSEGNPLFFSALLDSWIARGLLARGSPALAAGQLARDLPESLEAVIGLELARLPEHAGALLAAASVSGVEFSLATVAAAAQLPALEAAQELELLTRRARFVRRVSPGKDARYAFLHVLPREAVYRGLADPERRELHLRTALQLESHGAGSAAEIARHFDAAAAPARALPHHIAAAVSAGARFGYAEATQHLRGAVAALHAAQPAGRARDEQELPFQLGLAMALLGSAGSASDAALATLTRAEALCVATADHARRPLVLAGIWNCRLTRAELSAAAAIARELRALAEDGQPSLANLAHLQSGMTLFYQGDSARAARHLEHVLADAPAAREAAASLFDDIDPGVVARAYLAWLHALAGRSHAAEKARGKAVALALRLASPQGRALALTYSAALLAERGDAVAARAEAERALAVADEFGLPQWGGIARAVAGFARGLAREGEPALAAIEGGIAEYHATGARLSTSFLLSLQARTQRALGRLDDARATLALATAHCERTGERYYGATLRQLAGELREA